MLYKESLENEDGSAQAYLADVMGMMQYQGDAAEFEMVLDNMMNDWMNEMGEEMSGS